MWNIYALGDVTFLQTIFNAIAMIFSGSTLLIAAKIFLLLSVLQLSLQAIFQAKGIPWQQVLVSWLVFMILFTPKVTVNIHDRDHLQSRAVDNIPLGIASFASVTSSLGWQMSKIMSQAFSSTSGNNYGVTQSFEQIINLRSRLIQTFSLKENGQISDQQKSWLNYFNDCTSVGLTLNPSASGALSLNNLMRDPLPQAVQFTSSIYKTQIITKGTALTKTCTEAYSLLQQNLTDSSNSFMANATAGNSFNFAQINNDITAISKGQLDAEKYISIVTLASLMSNVPAYTKLGQVIKQQSLAQLYTQWSLQGNIFLNTVKPLLTFLEGFFFAISPIVMLLMLLGGYGLNLLGKYAMLLVWLQMWQPIITMINLYYQQAISNSLLDLHASAISITSFTGISLFSQKLESYIATSGLLLSGVGSLALFVIYGGAVTATSLVSKLAPPTSGQTTGALTPAAVASAPVIQGKAHYSSDALMGVRVSGSEGAVGSVNVGAMLSEMSSDAKSNVNTDSYAVSRSNAHTSTSGTTAQEVISSDMYNHITSNVSSNSAGSSYQKGFGSSMGSSSVQSEQSSINTATSIGVKASEGFNLSAGIGGGGKGGGGLFGANFHAGVEYIQSIQSTKSHGSTDVNQSQVSNSLSNQSAAIISDSLVNSTNDNQTQSHGNSNVSSNSDNYTAIKQVAASHLHNAIKQQQNIDSLTQTMGSQASTPILSLAKQVQDSPTKQQYLSNLIGQNSQLTYAASNYERMYAGYIPDQQTRRYAAEIAAVFNSNNPQFHEQKKDLLYMLYFGEQREHASKSSSK